jgi:chitin disaccharide deacetylase
MSPQRVLIVNADDFGLSDGVNAGIIDAHEHGIVTSASLMVAAAAAPQAAAYARGSGTLSVGLHADLCHWEYEDGQWRAIYERVDPRDGAAVEAELGAQVGRFRVLVGSDPTHIDSHQHFHLEKPAAAAFRRLGGRLGVPVRRLSGHAHYVGDFYGQTARGEALHDAITPMALAEILRKLAVGTTELACHPGRGMGGESSYGAERELELAALCDLAVRETVESEGIALRSFRMFSHADTG